MLSECKYCLGINYKGPIKKFECNEQVLIFYDPDSMKIELVAHKDAKLRKDHIWEKGPTPKEYTPRGFFLATLSLEGYERTVDF